MGDTKDARAPWHCPSSAAPAPFNYDGALKAAPRAEVKQALDLPSPRRRDGPALAARSAAALRGLDSRGSAKCAEIALGAALRRRAQVGSAQGWRRKNAGLCTERQRSGRRRTRCGRLSQKTASGRRL